MVELDAWRRAPVREGRLLMDESGAVRHAPVHPHGGRFYDRHDYHVLMDGYLRDHVPVYYGRLQPQT